MRIKVSYSELKSTSDYGNRKAEAELEIEVNGDINEAYTKAWQKVRSEVKKQFEPNYHEDLPF